MAGSVNKVILVGNLGKDPDVRRLNSGDQVVSFSVATSETWRDKASGERKERTEWHNVVIFNENLGKVAEQYCKKGTKVYVEGQLQTRKWQDQSGADRYTTEVVLQRFRGELQLLDLRGGGEGRDSFPEEGAPRSASFNRAAASERRPALSGGGGGSAGGGARSTTTSRFRRGVEGKIGPRWLTRSPPSPQPMDEGFQSFPSRVAWRENRIEGIPRQAEVEGLDQCARSEQVGDDDVAAKHHPLARNGGLDGVSLFAEAERDGQRLRLAADRLEPALPVGRQGVIGKPVVLDERIFADAGGRRDRLAFRHETGAAHRVMAVAEQLVLRARRRRPRVADGEIGFVRPDNPVGPYHRQGNAGMARAPIPKPRRKPAAREGVGRSDAQRRVVLVPAH